MQKYGGAASDKFPCQANSFGMLHWPHVPHVRHCSSGILHETWLGAVKVVFYDLQYKKKILNAFTHTCVELMCVFISTLNESHRDGSTLWLNF